MVANFNNSDRKSEHPGRTYTNFLPTSVGIVEECTRKSMFLNPLAFQAGSHVHRIPLRSNTTFNHRLEKSDGTRHISSILLTPLIVASQTWFQNAKKMNHITTNSTRMFHSNKRTKHYPKMEWCIRCIEE